MAFVMPSWNIHPFHSFPLFFTVTDRLGTIIVAVHKWESREQRGKAVYPKSQNLEAAI